MVAVRGHYDGGAVFFEHTPPTRACDVIVTFLDDDSDYDPVDAVAASRINTVSRRYSDSEVRGSLADRPPVTDDNDGWE
jgi:hypothetical protein